MTTTMVGLTPLVWGAQDLSACRVTVPPDVIRWRLRIRNTDFAKIWLRFPDRVEYWAVFRHGNELSPGVRQRIVRIK